MRAGDSHGVLLSIVENHRHRLTSTGAGALAGAVAADAATRHRIGVRGAGGPCHRLRDVTEQIDQQTTGSRDRTLRPRDRCQPCIWSRGHKWFFEICSAFCSFGHRLCTIRPSGWAAWPPTGQSSPLEELASTHAVAFSRSPAYRLAHSVWSLPRLGRFRVFAWSLFSPWWCLPRCTPAK